jgi:hypothetical protein
MKERISEPINTTSKMISIVLKVFFFCIVVFPYWLLTFVEWLPERLGDFCLLLVCLSVSPVSSGFLSALL